MYMTHIRLMNDRFIFVLVLCHFVVSTLLTYVSCSTDSSTLSPHQFSLRQPATSLLISPSPSPSTSYALSFTTEIPSPTVSTIPGVITIEWENSTFYNFAASLGGGPVPVMRRRCSPPGKKCCSLGWYIDKALESCMLSCFASIIGTACNRRESSVWLHGPPRTLDCAMGTCGALPNRVEMVDINGVVRNETYYASSISTFTPNRSSPSFSPVTPSAILTVTVSTIPRFVTVSWEDSKIYTFPSSQGGGPVPVMWRRCATPGSNCCGVGWRIDASLRSCMLSCLSSIIGSSCVRSESSMWLYGPPRTEQCATRTCGAVRTIVEMVNTNGVRLNRTFFSPSISSPFPSPSPSTSKSSSASTLPSPPIDGSSATPTPSPVRLPDDFVLSDKKSPNETAKVAATIIEVEVERLIDEELGTVGSDIRTEFSIVQRRSENSISSVSFTAVAQPITKNCLPGKNCRVKVTVFSTSPLPKDIIRRATQKLRASPGYGQIFKTKDGAVKIKRKRKGKQYVVTIRFKGKFLGLP